MSPFAATLLAAIFSDAAAPHCFAAVTADDFSTPPIACRIRLSPPLPPRSAHNTECPYRYGYNKSCRLPPPDAAFAADNGNTQRHMLYAAVIGYRAAAIFTLAACRLLSARYATLVDATLFMLTMPLVTIFRAAFCYAAITLFTLMPLRCRAPYARRRRH